MGAAAAPARLGQAGPGRAGPGEAKARLVWRAASAEARLPAEDGVEHVLMAVTLAAARRLRAVHHCLKPARHVHLQHLVAPDETVLLWGDRTEAEPSGPQPSRRLKRFAKGRLPAADGILAFFCDLL